jgi:hypothetical protein
MIKSVFRFIDELVERNFELGKVLIENYHNLQRKLQ